MIIHCGGNLLDLASLLDALDDSFVVPEEPILLLGRHIELGSSIFGFFILVRIREVVADVLTGKPALDDDLSTLCLGQENVEARKVILGAIRHKRNLRGGGGRMRREGV